MARASAVIAMSIDSFIRNVYLPIDIEEICREIYYTNCRLFCKDINVNRARSAQNRINRAEEGESSQHQSQNIGTETKGCADKCSSCIGVPWVWKLISLKIVQKFNEKVLIPLYGSGSP